MRVPPDQPDTQTYLDALNREVRTGEKCFDGQYLYVDNLYDNQGHLSKTSYPCERNPGDYGKFIAMIIMTE